MGMLKPLRLMFRIFLYIAWSIAWSIAPTALDKWKRSNPRIRDLALRAFQARERFRSDFLPDQKMKILFSHEPNLEKNISEGFSHTPHVIAFETFTSSNILDYDLIVPLTLPDLKYLSEVRHLIADHPIPIPCKESIVLCDDKYLLNESLAAKGFGDYLPRMGGPLTYPYIVKKRIDLWGRNSHLVLDKEQEEALSDISARPEYFSQNFIKGSYEYATHILFKNQRIVHSMNIEYKFETETPIKGQNKAVYTMICHCPYLDLFAAMLTSIGFNGLCCVNYKVCDGHLFLLEINPRFGGSLSRYFSSFIRHTVPERPH
jgi:hypothetical protein